MKALTTILAAAAVLACTAACSKDAEEAPAEPQRPVGATCDNASAFTLPAAGAAAWEFEGDLSGMGSDYSNEVPTTGYSWVGRDMFFSFEASEGDRIEVSLDDSSGFDGGVYIVHDCSDIDGSQGDGHDTTTGNPAVLTINHTGTNYLVVDAWADPEAGGPFTLTVARAVEVPSEPAGVIPANNVCSGAEVLNIGENIAANTSVATSVSNERIEASGYTWAGPDLFYKMDLTEGQSVNLQLDDRGQWDAGLYIFTDCDNIAGSTVWGQDTNAQSGPHTFTAPAAATYYLAVDGWQDAHRGAFVLRPTAP